MALRSEAEEDLPLEHGHTARLTPVQLSDLELMRALLPRPPHISQREWEETLLLEAPSVLGLASGAANVLDTASASDAELEDASEDASRASSVAEGLPDSPASPAATDTTMPYSPSASEVSSGDGINIETGLPHSPPLPAVLHPG